MPSAARDQMEGTTSVERPRLPSTPPSRSQPGRSGGFFMQKGGGPVLLRPAENGAMRFRLVEFVGDENTLLWLALVDFNVNKVVLLFPWANSKTATCLQAMIHQSSICQSLHLPSLEPRRFSLPPWENGAYSLEVFCVYIVAQCTFLLGVDKQTEPSNPRSPASSTASLSSSWPPCSFPLPCFALPLSLVPLACFFRLIFGLLCEFPCRKPFSLCIPH